jgi:hypothetical protein
LEEPTNISDSRTLTRISVNVSASDSAVVGWGIDAAVERSQVVMNSGYDGGFVPFNLEDAFQDPSQNVVGQHLVGVYCLVHGGGYQPKAHPDESEKLR